MGKSLPGAEYNVVAKRWEVRTKLGSLKFAVDDANTIVTKFKTYIGSTAPVGAGTQGVAIGSLAVTGLVSTDKIFVTPKAELTLGLAGARVTGADNITFEFLNPNLAVATQPAVGWDIFAVSVE